MKVFTIIMTIIAVALIIFNATKVNLDAPFEGDSVVALITIFTSLCAIVILQIFRISKRVVKESNKR